MKIAVIGLGSWGTALAKVLVENGHSVIGWSHTPNTVAEINHEHTNRDYLPNVALPLELKATNHLEEALQDAQMVLIVLPTKAIRAVVTQIGHYLTQLSTKPIIVHATKGLEQGSHLRISQVIEDVLPRECYEEIVVLSGPSHAEEVARQDLTTITAACPSLDVAKTVQQTFMNPYFRIYTNTDVIGVEMGAALKNIIALGAGILHGVGYGDNAKAALVTRGLAEISRLGIAMGADPLTFIGLSGVGDLVVTCTSPHSRNWQAGNLLAKGYTLDQIEQEIMMVVEGIATCKAAYELAQQLHVEMPITESLYQLLYEGISATDALKQLMAREGKQEISLQHL